MTQSEITDRLDTLEAQLDDQQATIEEQQERIDKQAETIERQQERLEEQDAIIRDQRERLDEEGKPASELAPAEQETADDNSEGPGPIATRRGILTSAGVLGLLGLGAGTASADASGQIGTSSDPLQDLHTANLHGDSGTVAVNDNLDVQSGTVENTTGNLTLKTSGTQAQKILAGTSSIGANNSDSSTPPNVIGGHPSNNTGGNSVKGVTIAGGGGDSGSSNNDNAASADWATVGGGKSNTASDPNTTVAGGNGNTAKNSNATVAGGFSCTADGYASTVGGGTRNDALGWNATVPGGSDNVADGEYSFAAGRHAETGYNDGTFVWADSSDTTFTASATDEVRFQATGGFVIAPGADKTAMLDVQDKDGNSLLAADTSNHKVQVFDADASDSVDVSHDGTEGEISTSTGFLKLNPDGNVELVDSDITSDTGFNITTRDGGLKLDSYLSLTLNAGGVLTKPVEVTGGPFTRPTSSVSADTTLEEGKYFVEVDTSSSDVTITLPDSPFPGEEHVIKKSGSSNTLTIDGNNDNIDGSSSVSLGNDNDAKKVVYDGSEWQTQSEVSTGGDQSEFAGNKWQWKCRSRSFRRRQYCF